jgi:phage terminase large subunit
MNRGLRQLDKHKIANNLIDPETGQPQIKIWRRKPDLWVRDVVGIGLGKCKCNPPCKMDPLHRKVLRDYGSLIHAKEMVHNLNILEKNLVPNKTAEDTYWKLHNETLYWQSQTEKDPDSEYAKKQYNLKYKQAVKAWTSISANERNKKLLEIGEEKFGWSRKILGISLQTAKGVGKTALMTWMLMHFYSLHQNSKGFVMAPRMSQLNDNLKAEAMKWIRHSEEVYGKASLLSSLIEVTSKALQVKMPERSQTGKTQFCSFRSADSSAPVEKQEQMLQGYHEDYELFGVDEGSGVPDPMFKPIMTTLTGKVNIIVVIFNPNRNSGFAFDTQNRLKEQFLCYQLSAMDSELISKDQIENMRKFYENDPNGWRVSVLGLPPTDDESALIPYAKITEARQRQTPAGLLVDVPRVGGFDIGAGGDPSAIAVVQGPKCHAIYTCNSGNDREIENFAVDIAENERLERIGCDGIGIGFFMAKMLREYSIDATSVDSRVSSPDPRFYNMRAYLFWQLREWIINGGDIPEDDEVLAKELSILRIERHGQSNKMIVTSKEKLRKEGHRSPNRADSLMLAMSFTRMLNINANQKRVIESRRDKYLHDFELYRQISGNNWMGL